MLLGVSDRKLETSVTPYKVSWSVPNNSVTLRSMLCSFCCLPAAPACGLLPSAAAQKKSTDTVHKTVYRHCSHEEQVPKSKVARTRAPPARLSLCSQTLSELAGRFVLADKEGPDRERRHQSALGRACSDTVG